MNKYHNGKIYKIVDIGYNKQYFGSTVESLSHRMAKHRYKYKFYLKDEGQPRVSCYGIFEDFGIENCKIELVEYFSCETKDELFKREGEYIKNNDYVNKVVSGRTLEEYKAETKEQRREGNKLYYERNKPTIQVKHKQYREENKDKIKQINKTYYEKNKKKWTTYYQKHQEALNNLNNSNNVQQQSDIIPTDGETEEREEI